MRVIYYIMFLFSFPNLKGKENIESISLANLKENLLLLTHSPHPFGSINQHKLAKVLEARLKKFALFVNKQDFQYEVPDRESFLAKDYTKFKLYKGSNIIALKEGRGHCAIVIGGHYDTKHLHGSQYVGANDNGSSIALLLELSRILKNIDFKKPNSPGVCDINVVFFDGEESVLSNWKSGESYYKKKDNLYGSRYFTQNLSVNKQTQEATIHGKPIKLALILDMIGHKNQALSIPKGSDPKITQELLKLNTSIKMKVSNINIEDDHSSFLKHKIPSLLIIDWTNLSEWHSPKDKTEIISYKKIKSLGELILNFLKNARLENPSL